MRILSFCRPADGKIGEISIDLMTDLIDVVVVTASVAKLGRHIKGAHRHIQHNKAYVARLQLAPAPYQ